jgi:hypothetical protein
MICSGARLQILSAAVMTTMALASAASARDQANNTGQTVERNTKGRPWPGDSSPADPDLRSPPWDAGRGVDEPDLRKAPDQGNNSSR